MLLQLSLLSLLPLVSAASFWDPLPPPAVHYTLERRGGAFAPNWTANLTYLLDQLSLTEARFNLTRREVKGNKIVRVPKEQGDGGGDANKLISEYGRIGNWFAKLKMGTPPQKVELDLDMLTADFAITTTSSNLGSRYEDFFSSTYLDNPFKIIPFPNCGFPSDLVSLPTVNKASKMHFAHCRPRRQSRDTLNPSGSVFGLAPSLSLSQMGEEIPRFIDQLISEGIINEQVFSLHLINGEEGILSIGGTIAEAIAQVEERIEAFLGKPHGMAEPVYASDPQQDLADAANGASDAFLASSQNQGPDEFLDRAVKKFVKRDQAIQVPTFDDLQKLNRAGRPKTKGTLPTWRDGWKWSPVEGAAGWWQILMRGIWADQVKIMKNQPCIVDLNTPFILAPPLAAKAFYASISGSHRLPAPYSNFYAYPCNNPPFLHFEFGGWRFPVMRGTKSPAEHRGANGKFSLGKVSEDSGYCVGAVVETRMGVGDVSPVRKAGVRENSGLAESGILAGNGLRDVWVLGEPVFRGMGLVFDIKNKQVGFRSF